MSVSKKEIFIFFHIANLRYSKWVFKEIYRELEISGLLYVATEVHFSIVGEVGFRVPKKINFICHQSKDLSYGEFYTLELLSKKARENPNGQYLYIHTKGISRFWNRAIRDWRKYMTYFCINEYKQALKTLENYDACGVDLSSIPKLHFSGNFWWARGDYLNTLPSIASVSDSKADFVHSIRHNAEFWIGMGEGKLCSLHESGIDVYQRHIHRFNRKRYVQTNL